MPKKIIHFFNFEPQPKRFKNINEIWKRILKQPKIVPFFSESGEIEYIILNFCYNFQKFLNLTLTLTLTNR